MSLLDLHVSVLYSLHLRHHQPGLVAGCGLDRLMTVFSFYSYTVRFLLQSCLYYLETPPKNICNRKTEKFKRALHCPLLSGRCYSIRNLSIISGLHHRDVCACCRHEIWTCCGWQDKRSHSSHESCMTDEVAKALKSNKHRKMAGVSVSAGVRLTHEPRRQTHFTLWKVMLLSWKRLLSRLKKNTPHH